MSGDVPRSRVPRLLRRAAGWALDVLYPRACAGCGHPLAAGGAPVFCARCRSDLPWIAPPYCARCGEPFASAAPDDAARFAGRSCAACRADPPAFAAARAAWRHEGAARGAVHALKFRFRREAGPELAGLLHVRFLEDPGFLGGVSGVVPMPLHPARLRERGYNQAETLGRPLAALLGVPLLAGALRRTAPTRPQVGLDRAARRRNVAGAFAGGRERPPAGATLLLVDDVMTTGATMHEAAKALLGAGAGEIRAAALARG